MAQQEAPALSQDLGLGSRVAQAEVARMLNRDGSFNVIRRGVPFWRSLNLYHVLTTCSWVRFYGLLGSAYLATNFLFAAGYMACGDGALAGSTASTLSEKWHDAFFFSVQTLATIGYGAISPRGLPANILVAVEALFGLLGVALATGLSFSRFSRPQARILFAEKAVIAPYQGGQGFMFRIANERRSQLNQVAATVVFSHKTGVGGGMQRRFHPLTLERAEVVFLPLHWTVVHAIDDKSPLKDFDEARLRAEEAEVLILLTAFDEASSQTVHARSSYKPEEIEFGVKYRDMFVPENSPKPTIDLSRLSQVEKV